MSINKKTTRKTQSSKKDVKIKETYPEQLRDQVLSVPMRPTWVAFLLIILYSLVKPRTNTELDYGIAYTILGLGITVTAVIAIKTKEFPGLFSMYTEPAATNLGWFTLVAGPLVVLKGVLQVI
jgi:hypothetical protein